MDIEQEAAEAMDSLGIVYFKTPEDQEGAYYWFTEGYRMGKDRA